MVRLVDAFAVLRRLRGQAELLVQLAPQLLEFRQTLAEIVVLKMTAGFWILVLAIRIFIEVDALEIVEVQVVDVGVDVSRDLAALVRRQGE